MIYQFVHPFKEPGNLEQLRELMVKNGFKRVVGRGFLDSIFNNMSGFCFTQIRLRLFFPSIQRGHHLEQLSYRKPSHNQTVSRPHYIKMDQLIT